VLVFAVELLPLVPALVVLLLPPEEPPESVAPLPQADARRAPAARSTAAFLVRPNDHARIACLRNIAR
jgi:hypothetical protein